MHPSPPAIDTLQRLVDQVQALSAVAETLTLRLLDLEERILMHERSVEASQTRGLGPEAEQRLADTEVRLQGLEQLLAPPAGGASAGGEGFEGGLPAEETDAGAGWIPEEDSRGFGPLTD